MAIKPLLKEVAINNATAAPYAPIKGINEMFKNKLTRKYTLKNKVCLNGIPI